MSFFREEAVERQRHRLHGEVIFSQPISVRILSTAFFVTILIAAAWFSLGTYARIETVPGVLVTDLPSTKIIPLQGGRVSELLVTEGQVVKKGAPLLMINSDRQTVGGEVATRSLDALEIRRQLSQSQVVLAENRADAEAARLSGIISSAEKQSRNLRQQIELQEQIVSSKSQLYDQIAQVVEQGFVSQIEFENRRQAMLAARQALAGLRERLTASEAEAQQARSQLSSVTIETAQSISQIEEGMQAISAEEARLQGEQSYVIAAPISGRVTALATGEGRPVTLGRPLLVIVPVDANLSAELYAPTRAIGFVEPGKETRLLYDAFPYQRFGSFQGEVSSISRIAVDPRDTDIPLSLEGPVYRIRVRLANQKIQAFGEDVPLQPGMTLQANLVLERQSFLAWLLQPLNAVLNKNS